MHQVTGKTADAPNEATREYLKAHDVQYDKAKEVLKQETTHELALKIRPWPGQCDF